MRHSAIVLAIALASIAAQAGAAPPDLSNRLPGKTPGTPPEPPLSTQSVMGGGDTFATATVIPALPYTDTGTTAGFTNNYNPPCAGYGAYDVVYLYQPSTDVCVTVSLCGSGFDTALYICDALTFPITPFACNDDYCGNPPQQSKLVRVPLQAGHSYYIVVDGYGCDVWSGYCDFGSYTLSVTTDCPAPCVVTCPPGAIAEGETCGAFLNDGCNLATPQFTDIPASPTGVTLCGTYGSWTDTYGNLVRDTDWYRITLTERTRVRLCATGEVTTMIAMVDGRSGCPTTSFVSTFAEPCLEGCVEAEVNPGTYYMFVASIYDPFMGCGRQYVMTTTCTPLNQFRITATAGPGGTISPSGEVYVNAGADQTFSIVPDPGGQIVDVLVDGVSQGPLPSYTFPSVSADHTIQATFGLMGGLHCNDANGMSLSLLIGHSVTVTGVVISNFPISTGSRFAIQDATGGVVVFGAPTFCGSLGDLVTATGNIAQYNGLVELSNPLSWTLLSSGNPQPAPVVLTPTEVNGSFHADRCEPDESRLVQVRNVVIRSNTGAALPPGSTFATQTSYQLVAMDGTNAILRIVQTANGCGLVNPLIGTLIPLDCPVHVTGVLSQSDNSSPFTAGYQVQPRVPDDIALACPVKTVPTTWGSIKSRYR